MNVESFLRGVLGLIVLTGVLYLFSSKKKQIPWKLVGLGFMLQIVFAVGILHVPLIAAVFDKVSSFFVVVLEFTKQGSGFLFGNLLNVNTTGFIFAFQILPPIMIQRISERVIFSR